MKILPGVNALDVCEAVIVQAVQSYFDETLFQAHPESVTPEVRGVSMGRGESKTFRIELADKKK